MQRHCNPVSMFVIPSQQFICKSVHVASSGIIWVNNWAFYILIDAGNDMYLCFVCCEQEWLKQLHKDTFIPSLLHVMLSKANLSQGWFLTKNTQRVSCWESGHIRNWIMLKIETSSVLLQCSLFSRVEFRGGPHAACLDKLKVHFAYGSCQK